MTNMNLQKYLYEIVGNFQKFVWKTNVLIYMLFL